jgi:hypothetical protein
VSFFDLTRSSEGFIQIEVWSWRAQGSTMHTHTLLEAVEVMTPVTPITLMPLCPYVLVPLFLFYLYLRQPLDTKNPIINLITYYTISHLLTTSIRYHHPSTTLLYSL